MSNRRLSGHRTRQRPALQEPALPVRMQEWCTQPDCIDKHGAAQRNPKTQKFHTNGYMHMYVWPAHSPTNTQSVTYSFQ